MEKDGKSATNGNSTIIVEKLEFSGGRISGVVKVANFEYEKRVFARMSLDNWQTWLDVEASWSGNDPSGNADIFSFSTELSIPGVTAELAICCQQGGQDHWENNENRNFALKVDGPICQVRPGELRNTAVKQETANFENDELAEPAVQVDDAGNSAAEAKESKLSADDGKIQADEPKADAESRATDSATLSSEEHDDDCGSKSDGEKQGMTKPEIHVVTGENESGEGRNKDGSRKVNATRSLRKRLAHYLNPSKKKPG